ncbi:MAG: ATP-binding protein, partial [Holophagae bacterium]|nr:ATP-binding protein [Holophagae bacterium]
RFFSRTFITEGMRFLLISVARRLAGQGGDPVIQLQTAFGGGKTHTMLAVYHLACRTVRTDLLEGIPPVLDEAGIQDLPKANVAVIDGNQFSPSQPARHGNLTVNTLWGELAWQLLGKEGYDLVAASDHDGTSPGKAVLQDLLEKAAPCVILIDELVAFIRQLESGKYCAGTFDSNLSFVQALTEALKAVPNAMLLASLPESEAEVGGVTGAKALVSLEKYFGRVESVWKPVAADESFEIVCRRLFQSVGDAGEREIVCKAFAELYRTNSGKFPQETLEAGYLDRLVQSYPIHPEIFDRLYGDWSTLDKFQRTRGVLQYMAIIIHRLWNTDNRDALIMPGSIPLDDPLVRNKSIHYLPQGWEPVLEKEVDGPRSITADLDGHHPLFGSVQAARRTARTIFLGCAPASSLQWVRGLNVERILLGSVQPGQTVGVFEDVLKRLRDKMHYLYSDQDSFWLNTTPNLRREMEGRRQNILSEDVLAYIKVRISQLFARSGIFAGVHVFTASADVPDEIGSGPRLVILPPSNGYSVGSGDLACRAAEDVLRHRGEQPRQHQNRLIFLAAEVDLVSRLKDHVKTAIAWKSIVEDVDKGRMNLDQFQLKQAKRNREGAEQTAIQMVKDSYKWLLCPAEELPSLAWETLSISPSAANLMHEIADKLKDEEWIVSKWAPVHLHQLLNKWYFKDGVTEVSAQKVWKDCCHYLYLPRRLTEDVFVNALTQAVSTCDYFGFSAGKEGEKYLEFTFGGHALVYLDGNSLLLDHETASAYKQKLDQEVNKKKGQTLPGSDLPSVKTTLGTDGSAGNQPPSPNAQELVKKQFYGTVTLDPVKAKIEFATIMDEVVQAFTSRPDVAVDISVEIQATGNKGFDEALQRTIKENCNFLKFKSAEFDE